MDSHIYHAHMPKGNGKNTMYDYILSHAPDMAKRIWGNTPPSAPKVVSSIQINDLTGGARTVVKYTNGVVKMLNGHVEGDRLAWDYNPLREYIAEMYNVPEDILVTQRDYQYLGVHQDHVHVSYHNPVDSLREAMYVSYSQANQTEFNKLLYGEWPVEEEEVSLPRATPISRKYALKKAKEIAEKVAPDLPTEPDFGDKQPRFTIARARRDSEKAKQDHADNSFAERLRGHLDSVLGVRRADDRGKPKKWKPYVSRSGRLL